MKNRNNSYKAELLLPNNNIVVGFGSVLNLVGNYFEYNTSELNKETDLKALTSDWENVGDDIGNAIAYFETQSKEKISS